MKIFSTLLIGLALTFTAPIASARVRAEGFVQDDAAKKEAADAYTAWYNANSNKDYPKIYELAKAFMQKFPNDPNAKYVKPTIASSRGYLFNQALNAKNIGDMIKLGGEALAEDPDSVDYLFLLAYTIRTAELSANPPNTSHMNEATDYTQRTIKLIEDGKVPAVIPKERWNKQVVLSSLYQELGMIDTAKNNKDKALEDYQKASTLDPKDPVNFFQCGSIIYVTRYQSATQKYQAFPEADRTAAEPKPEVKAAVDEINKQADAVIDCWAHYLGLTAGNTSSTRDQVQKALTELYKFRHPDSQDGLQKLIDQYRSGTASS